MVRLPLAYMYSFQSKDNLVHKSTASELHLLYTIQSPFVTIRHRFPKSFFCSAQYYTKTIVDSLCGVNCMERQRQTVCVFSVLIRCFKTYHPQRAKNLASFNHRINIYIDPLNLTTLECVLFIHKMHSMHAADLPITSAGVFISEQVR